VSPRPATCLTSKRPAISLSQGRAAAATAARLYQPATPFFRCTTAKPVFLSSPRFDKKPPTVQDERTNLLADNVNPTSLLLRINADIFNGQDHAAAAQANHDDAFHRRLPAGLHARSRGRKTGADGGVNSGFGEYRVLDGNGVATHKFSAERTWIDDGLMETVGAS
jgi:hypothetical protein